MGISATGRFVAALEIGERANRVRRRGADKDPQNKTCRGHFSSVLWFATYGKIEWIDVEKYGQGLPIRNLQVIDESGIGNTQPLADRLRAEKRRFTAHCDRLPQH
jgi:hypothetical protein